MEDLSSAAVRTLLISLFPSALIEASRYEGTQSMDTKRFRVVGVFGADADDYQLYITTLPREQFNPEEIS